MPDGGSSVSERASGASGAAGGVGTRWWRELLDRRWPEFAVALLLLSLYALFRHMPLRADVVWQLWIARQLLGGARLYADIMEVNPPLWFWMAVPVQWLAERLAMPAGPVLVAAVFAWIGAAVALVARLVPERPVSERGVLLIAAALVLAVLPLSDFAQREHLCLIAALPYAALAARRADRLPVAPLTALTVGLLGAGGFALKHYFIAVPVMLELWLMLGLRRDWRPFRPETIALGVSALAYAAAVLLVTPEFLADLVPMVSAMYEGYERPFLRQITNGYAGVWLVAAAIFWKLRGRHSALGLAFLVTMLALALSYFAQQKGWRYHALSANGATVMAVAVLLLGGAWAQAGRPVKACLVAAVVIPFLPLLGAFQNYRAPIVYELMKDVAPGAPVAVLSPHPTTIWPMVEVAGHAWPLRYFGHWMVIHLETTRERLGSLPPDLSLHADRVRAETVQDLVCNPPELILVDDMSMSPHPEIDMLAFFNRSAAFRDYFSHYEKERVLLIYTAYRKRPGWVPDRPADCRTLH